MILRGLCALFLLLMAAIGPTEGVVAKKSEAGPVYLDPSAAVDTRVRDLLGRMTLEEKVGQMTQINVARLVADGKQERGLPNPDTLGLAFDRYQVGSVLSAGGGGPLQNTASEWAALSNQLQRYALDKSRLHIPIIYGIDAVHGHNSVVGATIFPHEIGLAATWDPDLVSLVYASTARSVRATGIHWNFAPVSDVARDLRWGRTYETFGEEPFLVSQMVSRAVRSLQSTDNPSGPLAATAKHFAGYSGSANGRDRNFAELPTRYFRQTFLPPFKAAVDAGVKTMMADSGAVNGVPVHASQYLLTNVLRSELGFSGFLISDFADINALFDRYRVVPSYKEAVRVAVLAGVDMSMVPDAIEPDNPRNFSQNLIDLVNEGAVPETRIDEAVGRILRVKFELGLFEQPYAAAEQADSLVDGADRDLARRAATESLTLLKNDGVLPLGKDTSALLVAGPGANSIPIQMGGWTIDWQGVTSKHVDAGELPPAVTLLDGIREAAPQARIDYVPDDPDQAAEAARAATAAVVVLSESVGGGYYAETDGDTVVDDLPEAQRALVTAIEQTGTPTVLVVLGGRPIMMTDLVQAPATRAVLMGWYPGTEAGHAVADVLFGDANPSGRLPVSWPATLGDAPLFSQYPVGSRYEPLFPFGFGLSYAEFKASGLSVGSPQHRDDQVLATVSVSNTGTQAGEDVIQLYAQESVSPVLVPRRRLVAFERLSLAPGETKVATLSFPTSELSVIPGDVLGTAPAQVIPGTYNVEVDDQITNFVIP